MKYLRYENCSWHALQEKTLFQFWVHNPGAYRKTNIWADTASIEVKGGIASHLKAFFGYFH